MLFSGAVFLNPDELKKAVIKWDGEILANDKRMYDEIQSSGLSSFGNTHFPDYIKITKVGEHGFEAKIIKD